MSKRRYLVAAGIVVAAVLISTLLYAALGNHVPVIASLVAEPEMVPPQGSCQIVCNTTAPEGDEFSYDWSASAGKISGEGAAVTWTAPSSVGSYNITVVVRDSHGAEARDSRTITVDNPPTIVSLTADTSWTAPGGSIQLACIASDPDGDALTYEWAADGGDVTSAGTVANWTAPETVGAYNITVVVKDGHGGEATGKLSLSVNLGTPPIIEKLVVTPIEYPYLRKSATSGCDFDVYRTKEYDIECVASDTGSELVYDWSCTRGDIAGEGSSITWTAPSISQSIKVTVRVMVSNAAGDVLSQDIVFWVSSCTCGSWGLKSGEISF